jgi:Cdc6-like AAA superfamily ATPase
MPEESSEPRFQFNAAAVHARSSDDLRFALALAEQRLEAAEQARREAEQARLDLTAELAQATAAKVALFKEKAALVNENELLLKRITAAIALVCPLPEQNIWP